MSDHRLFIFGLGAGSIDDITVGTVRRVRSLQEKGVPVLIRTSRHPAVVGFAAEGIIFDRSFDDVYDEAETFDDVYRAIAGEVLSAVRQHGSAAYLVPGHPMLGEKTVQNLLARQHEIAIDIFSGTSFIDSCLVAARQETAGLVVLDALSLDGPGDRFRKFSDPFLTNLPQLIYQVYDRQVAGQVKIALLEKYPPEHKVLVITNAGIAGSEKIATGALWQLDHPENEFDHLTSLLVPPLTGRSSPREFSTLLDIMAQLRHPLIGCPWDREQTAEKLKRYVVEEVYEVIDAIDEGDVDKYIEELGDLLLQVVFHAQLARETGDFEIEDVIAGISEKLVRRHPHVFGDLTVRDSSEVLANWEVIKRAEKGNQGRKSRLDGVPRSLPALSMAMEVSKRAAKAGFEWSSIDGVFQKVDEELAELREALKSEDHDRIGSEIGDLLFTVVNLARFSKVDAEDVLRIMVNRFGSRFRAMEETASKPLEELDQAALEMLWQAAKREESKKQQNS